MKQQRSRGFEVIMNQSPSTKTKNKFIQRFPRPKGMTEECMMLYQNQEISPNLKQEKIQNQINHYLTEWIRKGNKFCGELYSVSDISYFLNISEKKTLRFINRLGKETEEDSDWVQDFMDTQENTDKVFSREGMLRVTSAVLSIALDAGTDSLNQAKNTIIHIENYRRAHPKWDPLVYEQLNKSQANLNNATRNFTDLLKGLMGSLSSSSLIDMFSNIAYGKTQTFTMEQALELLYSKTSNPLDPAFLKSSIEQNGAKIVDNKLQLPEHLPSVSALNYTKDNSGKQIISELRLQQNEIDNHLADRRIQDAEIL